MISPGYLYEIGTSNINKRISLIVKKLLPLPHHAEEVIIQNDQLHIDVALHDGAKFLDSHLKTAVTDDGNNGSLRRAELRSYRCRQCETHCPQAARSNIA